MSENKKDENVGSGMFALAEELFPICRSITGDGVRQTLSILQREIPSLTMHEVPSGTTCFDWTVPPEWNIRDAYILDPNGAKIVDFKALNLHVVGYSTPIDRMVSLEELQDHLHSLPDDPETVPYVTSYYEERWGFCLRHSLRQSLAPGNYRVVIDSTLAPGHMTYGEVVLPGKTQEEVFLSTDICHPSLGNNELSGPVVTTQLVKWLSEKPNRRYTYRILYIPETIGSIYYLSRNLEQMKQRIVAGFNVICIGDDRCYSYLPSRQGDTLSDRIARHVLDNKIGDYKSYTFLDRGSDERQYCAPGVDLPIASIMRSKYSAYPEYHTSRDDLTVITPAGLAGGFDALKACLECLEDNVVPKAANLCEPQLGKRGLHPTMPAKGSLGMALDMLTMLAYCDGQNDLLDIAKIIKAPMWELLDLLEALKKANLVTVSD